MALYFALSNEFEVHSLAHKLHPFMISIVGSHGEFDKEAWEHEELPSCFFLHLKDNNINGFYNCSRDKMKLVRYLLVNCKVLQKMAVNSYYLVGETTKWKEEILKVT